MADGTATKDPVNVETYGEGDRHVVALHCSLGRAAGWLPVSKLLPDATFTAPDWPGHGKSAPWAGHGLMRDAAVDIADRAVGDRTVDLIGHSYGGIIALDFATKHPERVRSLTLIEPIFLAIAGQDDRPILESYLQQMQPHFDALDENRNEEAARLFMNIWGGGVKWEQIPEAHRAGLIAQIPVVDACKPGDENSPEEIAVIRNLDKITMPVQLIYGGRTLEVVQLVMAGLQNRLPHARMLKVEKAGHMLPLTHPQIVAETLQEFWSKP